jgi:membrane protein
MNLFWRRLYGALRRIFPGCVGQSQAVAFNMFLAVLPMLLLVLGVAASSPRLSGGFLDIMGHLRPVLPPGANAFLRNFLSRRGVKGGRLIALGLGGTLLAGAQMMRLFISGFQTVHGDRERIGFWSHNVRALLLLVVTLAPWLAAANLIVFAKQARAWMVSRSAVPLFVRGLWSVVYFGTALGLAMIALAVIYRVGRPGTRRWRTVLPGAIVATFLWWVVSAGFGFYMRHVPYGEIYGSLTAVIGLMLWMQLTATIVLIGDAYNAESLCRRGSASMMSSTASVLGPPVSRMSVTGSKF